MNPTKEMMELIGELAKLSAEIRRTVRYADSLRRTREAFEHEGISSEVTLKFTFDIVDQERKIRALTDKAMNRVHALAELYNAPPTESQVVQP